MKSKIHVTEGALANQVLKVKNGVIHMSCTGLKFIDKDTNQYVVYIPALELSGYGNTLEKAIEMMEQALDDFCDFLRTLKAPQLKAYLARLGWKHDIFADKEYSKPFADVDGSLKEFNALDNKVEYMSLAA